MYALSVYKLIELLGILSKLNSAAANIIHFTFSVMHG